MQRSQANSKCSEWRRGLSGILGTTRMPPLQGVKHQRVPTANTRGHHNRNNGTTTESNYNSDD